MYSERTKSLRFFLLKEIDGETEERKVPLFRSQYALRLIFLSTIVLSFNGMLVLVAGLNTDVLIIGNFLLVWLLALFLSVNSRALDKKLGLLAIRSYKWMIRHGLFEEAHQNHEDEQEIEIS